MNSIVGLQVIRGTEFAGMEWRKLLISALWSAVSGFGGGPKPQGKEEAETRPIAISKIEAHLLARPPTAADEQQQ